MALYRAPVVSQDLNECTLNNPSRLIPSSVFKDVTNKTFPCLHLSEDTSTGTLHQGIEALVLQLSISQTQMTMDQKLRGETCSRLESAELRNLTDDDNRASVRNTLGQLHLSKKVETSVNSKEVIAAKRPVSPSASQSTGSMELFLPSAQESNPIQGNNRIFIDKRARLHGRRSAEFFVTLGKKLKSKNAKVLDEDVQAAIGLTVASAETLVIADIMNECQTCQSLGPKAILDAAFMLRKERDALGLNDFSLGSLQSLPDSKWEEGLDDTVLEAECYGMLPTDLMEKGPCGDASRLTGVQSSESLIRTEILLTTVKALEANTESKTAEHPQSQCEESCVQENGVVQGITYRPPALDDKREKGSTAYESIQSHLVAQKNSFNSRWVGGWTGVNYREDKQTCYNQRQAERHDNYLKLETSELSETCDLPPPTGNLLKCSKYLQTKSPSCAVASVPEAEIEALSTGSCAEILLALSQASIKCSFQEPLCSYVPCSVNATVKPSATDPVRCNGVDCSDDMTNKHTSFILNDVVSDGNHDTSDKPQPVVVASSNRGTKRFNSNSLKNYSTNFSMLEGALQATEIHHLKQVQEKEEKLLDVGCHGTDSTVKADGPMTPPNKKAQCELILEDSALQDSPPLIWHRGKRRRFKACRIAESDLTQSMTLGRYADSLSDSSPVLGPAKANFCSEPDITKIAEYEGRKTIGKEEVPLLSCGNHLTTKNHPSNMEPGLLEEQCCKMNGTGQCSKEMLEILNTRKQVYKRRERSGTSSQLFKGVSFLVTGFPASQKNNFEQVCKKIQDHGGVILSSVPSFSSLNGQKTPSKKETASCHSILIAPQKVRTLKYLYGCAAGLLIVKPDWLDEVITKKGFLFRQNYKEKETSKQIHGFMLSDRKGSKDLIFSRIAAYVHGQRSYCLKLSLLIQHGAGKVVQSMRSLVQLNNLAGSLIRVVVAEHQSKISHIVKNTAARSGMPIVSGDWLIDSLLNGRLFGLPAAAKPSKSVKVSAAPKANTAKKNLSTKGTAKPVFTAKTINLAPCQEVNMTVPYISFLGQGAAVPALSRMGLSFVLDKPKTSSLGKILCNVYYKSICINGIIYSAGDVVEVKPDTADENDPYVAQIESFFSGHSSSINTRSAKTGQKGPPENSCFLCCRWFYRPSDTGFPCMGNGKELYLSQHFDDKAPVQGIIRKVHMVLLVGEETFINDAERGWIIPTQTSSAVEAADYICRFFYDYQKESLHQLKAALMSKY